MDWLAAVLALTVRWLGPTVAKIMIYATLLMAECLWLYLYLYSSVFGSGVLFDGPSRRSGFLSLVSRAPAAPSKSRCLSPMGDVLIFSQKNPIDRILDNSAINPTGYSE